jgi:hypothetical protein
MTFQTRWWLPMAMAGSLVVACSSSGGGGGETPDGSTPADTSMGTDATMDAPGDTASPTDARADVRTDTATDRTPPASPCSSATDLSTMMPGADGAIHVTGSITANDFGQIGDLMMGCMLMPDTKINTRVYRYTMRGAGRLQVSTVNDATDPMLDTVIAVLPTCSVSAVALACNDDVARGMVRSTVNTGNLMMGQTVFIVLGTYGAMGGGDQKGPFEMTVRETTPGAAAGPCRTAAPFCDMGLQCSVAAPTTAAPGTCVRPVAVGMPCTAMDTCITGSACIANPGSTTMGTCRADGSAGGRCRVGAPMGTSTCDMGLACTSRAPTAMATGLCRTSVAADAECDPTQVMNACAAGTSCRPSPTAMNIGRSVCVTDGGRGGLCRTDSPRCDAMLECSSATAPTCRAAAMAGAACDVTNTATFCPTGSSCAPNAMLNGGTCAAAGTAAGAPCRDAADGGMRCDAMLTCSAATGAGFCQRSVAAGMPCDLRFNSTTCAMGGICSAAASGAATGTCAATTPEMEPNNTPATGTGPVTTDTIFRASLSTGDDVDCFRVTVPARASITAFTGDATGTCNLGMGVDTTLSLNNAMGMEIATNDDATGRGLCSEINATTMGASGLAAGTYSVCVAAYMGMTAIPNYYLTVRIVPGM